MSKIIIILIYLGLVISCSNHEFEGENNHIDTIYQRANLSKTNPNCIQISSGYFNRYNLTISNFYEVQQETHADINSDGQIDTIAILTPLSLVGSSKKGGVCFCDTSLDSRILIISLNYRSSNSRKSWVLTNFLSNEDPYNVFQKIKYNNGGIIIEGAEGSSIVFYYDIYFSYFMNNFYISKIIYSRTTSIEEFTLSKPFENHSISIDKFDRNLVDSIRGNFE